MHYRKHFLSFDALLEGNTLIYEVLALVEPLAFSAYGVRRVGVTKDEFLFEIVAGPIGLGTIEFAGIA